MKKYLFAQVNVQIFPRPVDICPLELIVDYCRAKNCPQHTPRTSSYFQNRQLVGCSRTRPPYYYYPEYCRRRQSSVLADFFSTFYRSECWWFFFSDCLSAHEHVQLASRFIFVAVRYTLVIIITSSVSSDVVWVRGSGAHPSFVASCV